ncbi:MAG: hypothetical protein K2X10_14260 [Hyphomicrobiales bacterium]|nr:hypothetical protein [Hyphomicrobiales bacterium]
MSEKSVTDRIPPMPRAVPMPPYPYQRDARSGGGAISGSKVSADNPFAGILVGSNLCG